MILLAICLHVEEELVFCGQGLVTIDMIDELFVTEFTQSLEINPIRSRLPFEIKEMGSVRFLPCRVILDGHFIIQILTWLEIITLSLGRCRSLITRF